MLFVYLTAGFLSFLVLNSSIARSNSDVVDNNCRKQLLELADSVSNFTRCAVNQAAPFKFCRTCYDQFDNVRNIKKLVYKKGGCASQLVGSERYQIVSHAYEFAKTMWEGSQCFNCFVPGHEHEDSIGEEWVMREKVTDFFDKQRTLFNCFKNFTLIPVNPVANMSSTNISMTNLTINIHSICKFCKQYYKDLNDVYKSLIEEAGGYGKENLVCADILSAMNSTRRKWSVTFNCIKISYDTASVIALTCLFGFLPVIFYSAAKLHGDSSNKKSCYNAIPQIKNDAD